MDVQLEKEMYINGRGRNKGYTTIQRYSNCGESRHNAYIYKKDEEMFNIYSSN